MLPDTFREPVLKASQAQRGLGAVPALGCRYRIGGTRFDFFQRAARFAAECRYRFRVGLGSKERRFAHEVQNTVPVPCPFGLLQPFEALATRRRADSQALAAA